jgi:hypothetical protein
VGHFCPPGSGSTGPIESGSNPDPDLKPCIRGLRGNRFLHSVPSRAALYHLKSCQNKRRPTRPTILTIYRVVKGSEQEGWGPTEPTCLHSWSIRALIRHLQSCQGTGTAWIKRKKRGPTEPGHQFISYRIFKGSEHCDSI